MTTTTTTTTTTTVMPDTTTPNDIINNNNATTAPVTNTSSTPTTVVVNSTFSSTAINTTSKIINIDIPLPTGTSLTPSSSGNATTTTTTTTGTGLVTTTVGAGNALFGLSAYHTLLVAVFAGCSALVLLVLCIICSRLLCVKRKRDRPAGVSKQQSTRSAAPPPGNHYADPYHIMTENHYLSKDVTRLYAAPDVTYAKPEIFSTFINPSFYTDVYARWKLQEQGRFEQTYDSPWQTGRSLKEQTDDTEFRWSTSSLRAVDDFDYGTYGHIPRSKLSSESDTNDAETVTTEPPSLTTF